METLSFEPIQAELSYPRRIAVTMHQKPDGDAIGASLGLFHYLKAKGHKVEVVSVTDYPENLKWMPGTDQVLLAPLDPDKAQWVFEGADLIFCLDFNTLHRLNEFEEVVRDTDGTKIMIDHHIEPEGFHDLAYWDPEASSTAELIYRLITELGDKEMVNADMASPLYAGIMTDTGSFRFTNTSPHVHHIVADLMEAGADNHRIYEHIFNNSSVDRLKFLGYCLSECLHVLPELNTAYIKLDREVFRRFNVKSGDTEGLVNYGLSIKGINLSILLSTQDQMVKLSFRSRGPVPSTTFAKEFGGGGHFYAAGGRTQGTLEEAETKLLGLLETHKEVLNMPG